VGAATSGVTTGAAAASIQACGLRCRDAPCSSCRAVGADTAARVLAVRRGAANDAAGGAAGRRLTAALLGASGCLATAFRSEPVAFRCRCVLRA
jgi:hypothetical protein